MGGCMSSGTWIMSPCLTSARGLCIDARFIQHEIARDLNNHTV